MRKIIKRYGDSAVITFSTEDLKTYQICVGDIIELSITKIINNNRETSPAVSKAKRKVGLYSQRKGGEQK